MSFSYNIFSRNLHANGLDDLILYVASSPDEVCTLLHKYISAVFNGNAVMAILFRSKKRGTVI